MPALGRGFAWLPDIAATLLAVVLMLVAVAAMGPQANQSDAAVQRQPPTGPRELVDAFWQVLHPGARPVFVVTAQATTQTGVQSGAPPLVFVLSHERYAEAVTTLHAAGVTHWREISVPPALAGPDGWNPRFLALGETGISRAAFPRALALVLDQGQGQGEGGGGAASRAAPAGGWLARMRWAGNLVLFLSGLLVLAWLRKARRG